MICDCEPIQAGGELIDDGVGRDFPRPACDERHAVPAFVRRALAAAQVAIHAAEFSPREAAAVVGLQRVREGGTPKAIHTVANITYIDGKVGRVGTSPRWFYVAAAACSLSLSLSLSAWREGGGGQPHREDEHGVAVDV